MVHRPVIHDGETCRIGTHASNDIVLADPSVSRFHCRLVLEEGMWRVKDTGSLNGTRIDGITLRDADLPVESVLRVGDSAVRVRTTDSPDEAHQTVTLMPTFGAIVGTSLPMRKLFATLDKISQSEINVLIQGESGTGKELVATEIVNRALRADKPFVIVDCGAISPALVESELFGHVRGAFTGADRERRALRGGRRRHRVPRRDRRAAAGAAAEAAARARGAGDPPRRRGAGAARSTCGSSAPPTASSNAR